MYGGRAMHMHVMHTSYNHESYSLTLFPKEHVHAHIHIHTLMHKNNAAQNYYRSIQCHTHTHILQMHHTDTNSSASLSSANLVTESNVNASHVNIDDEMRNRLSETETVEDDSQPPLSLPASEGEEEDNDDNPHPTHEPYGDNETVDHDDPHPVCDSTELHRDTRIAIPSQANNIMETEKSNDCGLTAANLGSNPEAFHDAEADDDVNKPTESQDKDPVLDDNSGEHETERTPFPDAIHEASPGSDTIKQTEIRQHGGPVSSEVIEKSSEHDTERSPSPANQNYEPVSPTDDLREIESFLSKHQ